jgi:lipopolysaccharide biosynthesis regulator YciM
MAVIAKLAHNNDLAKIHLNQALNANKNCVRANVLLGDIEAESGTPQAAITYWKHIEYQQPEYLGLIAPKLLSSYRVLNQTADGLALLQTYLQNYKLPSLINVLYEATLAENGPESAAILARTELIKMPSLSVLDQLLQARTIVAKQQTNDSKNTTFNDIQLMQQTVRHAIGNKTAYHCTQCGFKAKYHHWQCPACNAWETLPAEPTTV